jgi:hypothetical protein
MNLVFTNNFEKKIEDRAVTAQVSISEDKGTWVVIWNEEDNQIIWFSGTEWQTMMTTFRTRLAEKTSEGFLPVVQVC